MPDATSPAAPAVNVKSWTPEVVLPALGAPVRWRLLRTIAQEGPRAASQLSGAAARPVDATLKHLGILRDAGLLATSPDPADGRRMLYALAPSVPVQKLETGTVIDFGFCLLRV